MSVWCVLCSRAVPSTKWLPVSLWHIMAGAQQASSVWHRGELMKESGGDHLGWFRQCGWELGDGRKKPPLQAHEKRFTSSLRGGQSYQTSVLPPYWVATGSSLWGLSSFSSQSEASSQGIPRDHLVSGPSKTGDSPDLFFEKMGCE